MATNLPQIDSSWLKVLNSEFDSDYMKNLKKFIASELDKKKVIYPHGKEIFSAFNLTPFEKVKVVIVGQDPYHGEGQAHGLSFSVKEGVKKIPPSLQNVFKELKADLEISIPTTGCLIPWARQGVFLLNAT